ncbi:MAG: 50S ribosomal protein L18e [Candidatus Diapherotrites archaeon]|uniref:50S ribosomal protein L18e n=1 Tax=Candidatus Iainarchaeum sp. TaxID=3101447 RepID=A0A8T3YI33_9ARCH|nr:50S ribosomal protein L18e [Candidatus Diapherotrites archaeon]
MRTGPTNKSTRELIVDLDKHGKKVKNGVWRLLSKKLGSSSRARVAMNVYKLSGMAAQSKGKTIVVPGKVLSKGDIKETARVACFACSAKARRKIEAAGGKVIGLKELMLENPKASTLVVMQ